MQTIWFPTMPGPQWDFARESVLFFAERGGDKIECYVSGEALGANLNGEDAITAFLAKQKTIEGVARRKIEKRDFTRGTQITITTENLG